jgi:signal peptidase I
MSAKAGYVGKNQKGTWRSVAKEFIFVILLICGARWIGAEPFLVPSGSMIPTLLIKDYILVTKYSYGLRLPFTKKWILGPYLPDRGDVVVFKAKDDNFYFMVKRVVGLPGDKIQVDRKGHRLIINGKNMNMKFLENSEDGDFKVLNENLMGHSHLVQYSQNSIFAHDGTIEVPKGQIFMMGDNRDRSSDSRVWGTLPIENILGKAQLIWMSCKEDSPAGGVFCLGSDLRTERIGKKIK